MRVHNEWPISLDVAVARLHAAAEDTLRALAPLRRLPITWTCDELMALYESGDLQGMQRRILEMYNHAKTA